MPNGCLTAGRKKRVFKKLMGWGEKEAMEDDVANKGGPDLAAVKMGSSGANSVGWSNSCEEYEKKSLSGHYGSIMALLNLIVAS